MPFDDCRTFLTMLSAVGVSDFSGYGITVKLYPDGGRPETRLDIPVPSAKEAAKEAFEAAKRAMDEDEIDLAWSTT